MDPAFCLRQLGFDVDMREGTFRVPTDRWEALHSSTDALLSAKGGRVQARKIASLTGIVILIILAWGPVTQQYTRHMHVMLNKVPSLNYWVVLSEKARGELLFWQKLPRIRFEADILPPVLVLTIRVVTDASDFA